MKILGFMLKKDIGRTLIIGIALSLISVVFFISSCKNMYQYDEYTAALNSFSESDDIYGSVSEELTKSQSGSDEVMQEINDYVSGNQFPGKPPAVLPDELVEKLFAPSTRQGKYCDTQLDDSIMLSVMLTQIEAQHNSKIMIEERMEGYTRNVRRGVKDKYSLALSEKLIDDYTEVISYETDKTKLTDTRAADAFIEYMSSEIILAFGIYILLFFVFSSEIQSGRFRSFSVTKTGARKFTLYKIIAGYSAAAIFTSIWYLISVIVMLILNKDGSLLSAPLQYLSGFELSSETVTVGGYIFILFIFKLVYALFISSVIMLISMISRKTIIAGILSLAPIIFFGTVGTSAELSESRLGMIFSCNFTGMTKDINYVSFLNSPVKIYCLYVPIILLSTAALTAIIYAISGKRGI